jgi:hypothetical protein
VAPLRRPLHEGVSRDEEGRGRREGRRAEVPASSEIGWLVARDHEGASRSKEYDERADQPAGGTPAEATPTQPGR